MHNRFVIILLSLLFCLLLTCSENGTKPPDNPADTTSQNFAWQIDTIGAPGSWLTDIAVISENDIWAVGRIESYDTLPGGRTRGNLTRWDGNEWKIINLEFIRENGNASSPDGVALFEFSSGEVLIATGSRIQIWDGTRYTHENGHIPLLTGSIKKIWGQSTDSYYVVGNDGMILHYNNGQWISMSSGTNISLRDIDGNEDRVFVVGYNELLDSIVLEYRDGKWYKILSSTSYHGNPKQGDYGRTTGVMVFKEKAFIISKSGIVIYNYLNQKTELISAEKALMTGHDYYRISGKMNDLVLIGRAGHIIHYNGNSWKMFTDAVGIPGIQVRSGYINNNIIAACGDDYLNVSNVIRGLRK